MPDPYGDQIPARFREVLLEAVEVAARRYLHPQVAHDLEIRAEYDPMLRAMVLDMRTHLYRTRLGEENLTRRFSRERRVVYPKGPARAASISLAALGALATLYGLFLQLPWHLAGAPLVASALCVIYLAVSPSDETVEVSGEATVLASSHDAFPDNTTVYPKELGRPIRILVFEEPRLRYFTPE